MDRYRKTFDQALEQLGPDQAKVEAQRSALARQCFHETKEVAPMNKSKKFLRAAVIAAVVAGLLSVTAVAAVLGQQQRFAKISSNIDGGVFELDGRYYFKLSADSEPIDITGKFSDTVPYVYDLELPPDEHHQCYQYVIGGSGTEIGCVTALFNEGEDVFSGTMMSWDHGSNQVTKGCPVWWRTYCYSFEEKDTTAYYMTRYRDGFSQLPLDINDLSFDWVLDGLTADTQTGAVTLTVKGESMDVTQAVNGGGVYVLTVDGDEMILVDDDPSLLPDPPYELDEYLAYEESCVYAPCSHDVLVYRDGDEVRYAEFVYRPDGSLRYWMPWNCPTAADLSWLEDYMTQHGYGMDWMMDHAYEEPAHSFTQTYNYKAE